MSTRICSLIWGALLLCLSVFSFNAIAFIETLDPKPVDPVIIGGSLLSVPVPTNFILPTSNASGSYYIQWNGGGGDLEMASISAISSDQAVISRAIEPPICAGECVREYQYTLEESENGVDFQVVYSGTNKSHYVSNKESNIYAYRVKAAELQNERYFHSDYTQLHYINVVRKYPAPATINVPTATVTSDSIVISWAEHESATYYALEERINDGTWTALTFNGSPRIMNTSFTRTIPHNGRYQYRIQTCTDLACGDRWNTSTEVLVAWPKSNEPSVTWIPISVSDITIMVPYTPESIVYKDKLGNLYVKVNSAHGSKYLKFTPAGSGGIITELTPEEWRNLSLTISDFSIVYGEFTGDSYEDFKFLNATGTLTYLVERAGSANSYFIKPSGNVDGAEWSPNRVIRGNEAIFSWSISGASSCKNEQGNAVQAHGSIAISPSSKLEKSIICNGKTYSDQVIVLDAQEITLPTAISNPVNDSGTVVGAIPANFSVGAMGNAQYIMPIATAPGSAGLVPDISLSYDSGAGNGWLGMGWSISGISMLQTCSKTIVHDNEADLEESRLCLDGKRLFAIDGDYWAADTEYQLADKSPMRVIAGDDESNGKINTYTVTMPDGTSYIYGGDFLSARNEKTSWPLIKKQDVAGNYILFEYVGPQLEKIRYTGNQNAGVVPYNVISFNYERRSDSINTRYRAINERLSSVVSETNDAELRTYNITYKDGDADITGRSLIESINSCNGNTCLKATEFEWQEGNLNFADNIHTKIHSNSDNKGGNKALDANGDGVTDFWLIQDDHGSSDHVRVVQGGIAPRQVQSRRNLANVGFRASWEVIDFDNDGRDDIIHESADSWKIIRSTVVDGDASTINYDFSNTIPVNIDGKVQDIKIADFNGDGYADIVYYFNDKIYINYNQRDNKAPFSIATDVTPDELIRVNDYNMFSGDLTIEERLKYIKDEDIIDKTIRVADFDGDGISEVVFVVPEQKDTLSFSLHEEHDQYKGRWIRFEVTNSGLNSQYGSSLGKWESINFVKSRDRANTYYRSGRKVLTNIFPVDINFDGRSEIAYLNIVNSNGTRSPENFYIDINIKNGYSDELGNRITEFYYGNKINYNDDINFLFNDYDGDGNVELLYYDESLKTNDVWSIHSINDDKYDDDLTNIKYTVNSGDTTIFGEVDGNGVADFISFKGRINYQLSESKKRDLLTSVTNGVDQRTTINYKSLSDINNHGFYTRESDAQDLSDSRCLANGNYCASIIDFQQPINVVQNIIVDNKSNTNYLYKGLKAQFGVGLLGFKQVKAIETKTKIKVTSNYHQLFPFTGKLYKTSNNYLSTIEKFNCHTPNGGQEPVCDTINTPTEQLLNATEINYGQYNSDSVCSTDGQQHCTAPIAGYVYPKIITETNYNVDASGVLSTKVTTNSVADQYGNIGTTVTETSNASGVVSSVTSDKRFNDYSGYAYGGRLEREQVTYSRPNEVDIVQIVNYTHDANQNYLTKSKTVDKSGDTGDASFDSLSANFLASETYTRDDFGNVTLLVKTGAGAPTQATGFVYDDYGRFVEEEHQYLGYQASADSGQIANLFSLDTNTTYDDVLGLPITVTSANGQVTTNGYNALGRLNYTFNPDGSYITVKQALCSGAGACPTGAYYVETTEVSNGPNTKVYFDNKGLKLLAQTQTLANAESNQIKWVDKRYVYDDLNRLIAESVPHFSGDLSAYSASGMPSLGYSYSIYDDYHRVTSQYKPDQGLWTTSYDGLSSTITNPNNYSTTTVKNVLGETVSTTDANSRTVNYSYDALGNMRLVRRAGNNGNIDTVVKFDHLGRKVRLVDPDFGTIKYRYDGLGNLLWQEDNKGYRKCTTYDGLGRTTHEVHVKAKSCRLTSSVDAHTEYVYDQNVYGTGLLSMAHDHVNNIIKEYSYNELSLVHRVKTTIDNKAYYQDTIYDNDNQFRVKKVYDASRGNSGIEYHYNSNNYLTHKTDIATNAMIWQLLKTDAWGNATQYRYGNGVTTINTYDAYDGTFDSILATDRYGGAIQNSEYSFDVIGNLEFRKNHINGFDEQFGYDSLNRLDDWTKSGAGASGTIDINYDHLGNVTSKTGIGTYHYSSSRPHAVRSITNGNLAGSFAYDTNGNMTSGGGRSQITYNVNNKPTYIKAGSHTTEFVYSIGGSRVKRTDSKDETSTLYMGNVEFVRKKGKLSRIQRTIEGIAIETRFINTNETRVEYLHFDHLGSAELITNGESVGIKHFSFDPWGQRRSVDNYNTTFGITDAVALSLNYYNKGYTGHEHMDEAGLIHMNGRIYDPRIARFLNADPVVQQVENLQNLNRYSYVLNNPLNATDPTGYFLNSVLQGVMAYLSGASVAESLQIAAASYAAGDDVQFTYSSASGFSAGEGQMRSIESQAFDSFDLGGQGSSGVEQAKAEARVDGGSVTSGVSGVKLKRSAIRYRGSVIGRTLESGELSKVLDSFKPAQEALTKFINKLHSQKGKAFKSIMNAYGFSTAESFNDTRVDLIQKSRSVINLIGKFTTTPDKLYHSGGGNYGDATHYDKKKIMGFGSLYFHKNTVTSMRIDTVIHEFSHAVWTGDDGGYSDDNASDTYDPMAKNARRTGNNDERYTLSQSSYVYEYAVRSAQ